MGLIHTPIALLRHSQFSEARLYELASHTN